MNGVLKPNTYIHKDCNRAKKIRGHNVLRSKCLCHSCLFHGTYFDLLVCISECATFDGINMCNYENHRGMIAKLQSLAKRYPKLAKYNTVGKSVQGRQLGYIKISSNVTRRTRNEPMFKYVGKIKL